MPVNVATQVGKAASFSPSLCVYHAIVVLGLLPCRLALAGTSLGWYCAVSRRRAMYQLGAGSG